MKKTLFIVQYLDDCKQVKNTEVKAENAQNAVSVVRFDPVYNCYEVLAVFKLIKNWN